MTNPLRALGEAGQAPWLDYLHRRILHDGELKQRIEEDGLRGLTSNPSIFEKAIGEGDAYDQTLEDLMGPGDLEVVDLYERLAIADIQGAADQMRRVYDRLDGDDGFVSLEVSPYLGLDTEGTLAEARRLWRAVDRPNVMIKVPGTEPGVPAIRQLISEGINVNVTLLFGVDQYLAVAEAYVAGLESMKAAGGDVSRVRSVASFFVSRIDTQIDKTIDERSEKAAGAEAQALKALRGRVAIANARVAYQRYRELIASERWRVLEAAGAKPQRLLWASTSVKDPAYSDVLYVESLIGPDTVDTMPPETMDAFRDHGRIAQTLAEDLDGARQTLKEVERLGLDLDGVTRHLVDDGVDKFSQAFDKLLGAVAAKRARILGSRLNGMGISAAELQSEYEGTLDRAAREGWTRRLWRKDASLWPGGKAGDWLGWLDAGQGRCVDLTLLEGLREDIHKRGFSHAVLLGMGGSSLAPEVLARTFGAAPGFPTLLVLDSTEPSQVKRIAAAIDPATTLFIVSSKSGTTLEPDVLHRYFLDLARQKLGEAKAGEHFIAVTDPGSRLEATARDQGFWRVFPGEPTIGGRYSALSNFGLVAAAAIGLEPRRIFEELSPMVRACGAGAPPRANPGVQLGALLGVAARAGRDKVTLVASDPISDLGAWLEQLIAESTGKQGKGLIPIDLEPLGSPAVYGQDRVFAYIRLEGQDDPTRDAAVRALEEAGHPVARITVARRELIFQEFFRWEVAIAVAGAVIGIDPFDQPDVEASKVKTRELTSAFERSGELPPEQPSLTDGALHIFAAPASAAALEGASDLEAALHAHLASLRDGDYVGLLAYLDRTPAHFALLQQARRRIRDHTRCATAVEFGPRFLHSTGQAYKGGPPSGVFIQITADSSDPVPVPGRAATFNAIVAAEARGDFEVLAERGRRAIRIDLGRDVEAGLSAVTRAIERALG